MQDARRPPAVSFWKSFFRSQMASAVATLADFGTFALLFTFLHVWYVAAAGASAFTGAAVHFLLGRYWSFKANDAAMIGQATRYFAVAGMSLLLNAGGIYLFVSGAGFKEWPAKIAIGFVLGIFFNFPLHRHFVFVGRSPRTATPDGLEADPS